MYFKAPLLLIPLLSLSCDPASSHGNSATPAQKQWHGNDNPYASISEIPLPEGFERAEKDSNSFAGWLRRIELKKDKTVYKYNGQPKGNQSAQFAVLNVSVGNRNLQQCADAVMRLRAEFLFKQKKFDQITFYDNNKTVYQFLPPYTRSNFMSYLNRVFGMCGSASLSKQLKPVPDFKNVEAGDVLIRGGFPGHAVMVMDVATNPEGKKIYLLAQSFMPAQDIHILVNPNDEQLSPWYEVNNDVMVKTPEYWFYRDELKHW